MKKADKLLDAIGQIDDRFIEEACQRGGRAEWEQEAMPARKPVKKRPAIYRWRGALAACAVLAVCVGLIGILQSGGYLLSPFGGQNSTGEMAAADTVDRAAPRKAVPESGGTALTEGEGTTEMIAAAEAAVEEPAAGAEPAAAKASVNAQLGQEAVAEAEDAPAEDVPVAGYASAAEDAPIAENADEEAGIAPLSLAPRQLKSGNLEDAVGESCYPVAAELAAQVEEDGALTLTIVNRELDFTIGYGDDCSLELLREDGWQALELLPDTGWHDIAYLLAPGEQGELRVDLAGLFGALEAGQYRLTKEGWIEETGERFVLTAEFEFAG